MEVCDVALDGHVTSGDGIPLATVEGLLRVTGEAGHPTCGITLTYHVPTYGEASL